MAAIIFLLASSQAFAGQLADFEEAATQKNDWHRAPADRGTEKEEDDYWPLVVVDVIADAVSYGGRLSLARVRSDPDLSAVALRETGSPDLAFFRMDFGYQGLESGIDGVDGRMEVGYGPVGLQYRVTHMRQQETQERLDLSYLHGLYRISASNAFEVAVGLGQISLDGVSENTGASLTVPLAIYPLRDVGIRLAPTWSDINGNTIRDYDGSIAYVEKYVSVRVGYREIQTHREKLSGPYAGVSFHF